MKILQLDSHHVWTSLVVAVLALLATSAQAATIQVAFTGMNLVYDGSSIYDAGSTSGGFANPANADPLSSADFYVDGSLLGSLGSDISLDAFIPGVTNIPDAPDTVYSQSTGTPGFIDLLIGTSPLASEFVLMDVSDVTVSYADVNGTVQFTFGAAVADTHAANLPFGLEIGDPVSVSFSAQLDAGSTATAGGFLTGFAATGTGEIRGTLVPEPTSGLLIVLGTLAASLAARRAGR